MWVAEQTSESVAEKQPRSFLRQAASESRAAWSTVTKLIDAWRKWQACQTVSHELIAVRPVKRYNCLWLWGRCKQTHIYAYTHRHTHKITWRWTEVLQHPGGLASDADVVSLWAVRQWHRAEAVCVTARRGCSLDCSPGNKATQTPDTNHIYVHTYWHK